jgi:hypothetical protein
VKTERKSFPWNKNLKPYKDNRGKIVQKVAEEYHVGHVTVAGRKKKNKIERLCSVRASDEGLKERKKQ